MAAAAAAATEFVVLRVSPRPEAAGVFDIIDSLPPIPPGQTDLLVDVAKLPKMLVPLAVVFGRRLLLEPAIDGGS